MFILLMSLFFLRFQSSIQSKATLHSSFERVRITELAHELKLPLFNIKSFLETLYEYYFDLTDPQRLEFIETANKETNRLLILINSLVELESNCSRRNLKHTKFIVSDLVSQVVNTYTLIAKSKDVDLISSVDNAIYVAYGNSDLIGQVINNLVGNSLKYTFPGKRIYIRVRPLTSIKYNLCHKTERISIGVLDGGVGITRNRTQFIVNSPDYIGLKDFSMLVKGTGLGLYIVKKILFNHSASISILSQLNKGSIVGFSLLFSNGPAGEGT